MRGFDSLGGNQHVRVDEGNIVINCCQPKILRKDIQTKNNLIVALCPYVIGELMITETKTPPKPSRKSKPEHEKYKKRAKLDDDKLEEMEEKDEQQVEVVPPRGQMSSGILKSEHNRIRENIVKTKLVRKGQLFHLSICSI